MTDYYFSLPFALRITFDVFYSPRYLMIFVDKRNRAMISQLQKLIQSAVVLDKPQQPKVIFKAVSLWGREFKYDTVMDAPLASNEQSISDGLNYYGEIRDREIIRTLLTRTSDFDLGKIIDKLNEKGMTRLSSIIVMKSKITGKFDSEVEQGLLQNRKAPMRLDKNFKSDLGIETIPMLFPNDEAYQRKENKTTLSKASAKVSEVLKSFA